MYTKEHQPSKYKGTPSRYVLAKDYGIFAPLNGFIKRLNYKSSKWSKEYAIRILKESKRWVK